MSNEDPNYDINAWVWLDDEAYWYCECPETGEMFYLLDDESDYGLLEPEPEPEPEPESALPRPGASEPSEVRAARRTLQALRNDDSITALEDKMWAQTIIAKFEGPQRTGAQDHLKGDKKGDGKRRDNETSPSNNKPNDESEDVIEEPSKQDLRRRRNRNQGDPSGDKDDKPGHGNQGDKPEDKIEEKPAEARPAPRPAGPPQPKTAAQIAQEGHERAEVQSRGQPRGRPRGSGSGGRHVPERRPDDGVVARLKVRNILAMPPDPNWVRAVLLYVEPTGPLQKIAMPETIAALDTHELDLSGTPGNSSLQEYINLKAKEGLSREQAAHDWLELNQQRHVCARCRALKMSCDHNIPCQMCKDCSAECLIEECTYGDNCYRQFCEKVHYRFLVMIANSLDNEGFDGMQMAANFLTSHRWRMPTQWYGYDEEDIDFPFTEYSLPLPGSGLEWHEERNPWGFDAKACPEGPMFCRRFISHDAFEMERQEYELMLVQQDTEKALKRLDDLRQ